MFTFILALTFVLISRILRITRDFVFIFPNYIIKTFRSTKEPIKQICSDLWDWYPMHIIFICIASIVASILFLNPKIKEYIGERPDIIIESRIIDAYVQQDRFLEWRMNNFYKVLERIDSHPQIKSELEQHVCYRRWLQRNIDRYIKKKHHIMRIKAKWEHRLEQKRMLIENGDLNIENILDFHVN